VRDLLLRSEAFRKLPTETQQQIAHHTAQIADYLAQPEGFDGRQLATARALDDGSSQFQQDQQAVQAIGGNFQAAGALAGAQVAGVFLQKVNFPRFVASLIEGVFHAIVHASIEQMTAYAGMVQNISKTLNQFRDENVSQSEGQNQLVQQFPDLFQMGTSDDPFGSGGQTLQLKDGVDEGSALQRVNSSLPMDGAPLSSLDMSDSATQQKLTDAARTQLATSRQQLLATLVLMGINRIVVTDGKIQAKIVYDFQASDKRALQRQAIARDYARDQSGNVQKLASSQYQTESGRSGSDQGDGSGGSDQSDGGGDASDDADSRRDGSYYTKGLYQYAEQPIITAQSSAAETSEAALQTRATLSGLVDVNFKSDYFPLEKMADSFQIGMIQNAAKPGRGAAAAAGAGAAAQPPAATQPSASSAAPTAQPGH
jgi:hypothetical protein